VEHAMDRADHNTRLTPGEVTGISSAPQSATTALLFGESGSGIRFDPLGPGPSPNRPARDVGELASSLALHDPREQVQTAVLPRRETVTRRPSRRALTQAVVLNANAPHSGWSFAGRQSKLLAPLANRTLFEHMVERLSRMGIVDVTVVHAQEPSPAFSFMPASGWEARWGTRVRHVWDGGGAGTAGALRAVGDSMGRDPFLLLEAGVFLESIDLHSLLAYHREKGAVITVVADRRRASPSHVTLVEMTARGRIKTVRVPHGPNTCGGQWTHEAAGLYVVERAVLPLIPRHGRVDLKEQLIPRMIDEELSVYGHCPDRRASTRLANTDDLLRLERRLIVARLLREKPRAALDQAYAADASAIIDPEARIVGPVLIGPGCRIERGALIMGPTSIGADCRVGAGAEVVASSLWPESRIDAGASVQRCLVSHGCRIPVRTRITDRLVIDEKHFGSRLRLIDVVPQQGAALLHRGGRFRPTFGRWGRWDTGVKRLADLAVSATALVLTAPIFAGAALAVRLDSPGPIIYRQTRCGQNGKPFVMFKFRTMIVDADRLQGDLRTANEVDGPMFKMRNDPRVTRVGRWLRKTSIDELPQLINVLRGEMSLVGPRPLAEEEMRYAPAWRDVRLQVRPGLTGLWQVAARSRASFEDWIRFDVEYVHRRSLWLDARVLLQTVGAVLARRGF